MSQVIYGMLISNGRITMLEISRWTATGGSYRTIQRWYHTPLVWLQIQWIFFVSLLQKPNHEYIAAGDKVVFGKAGKETYGIGCFFSCLQNRVIPGLSFFVFSLIHVKEWQSYPMQAVQMVKEKEESKRRKRKNQSKNSGVLSQSKGSVRLVVRKRARIRKVKTQRCVLNYCGYDRFYKHFWWF